EASPILNVLWISKPYLWFSSLLYQIGQVIPNGNKERKIRTAKESNLTNHRDGIDHRGHLDCGSRNRWLRVRYLRISVSHSQYRGHDRHRPRSRLQGRSRKQRSTHMWNGPNSYTWCLPRSIEHRDRS